MNQEEFKFEYSPAQFRAIIEKIENDRISNFLRINLHRFFRWFIKSRNDFKVINQEILLRQKSNFVLASNHASHLDILCLFSALPLERINGCYSVAAEDYFFSNDLVSYFSRILANTLPFSRDYAAYAGLKACGTLLDQGENLIIFPEGTRSKTGEIQTFKPGIGILMAGRKEPVIPAYIQGAFEALPKGRLFPSSVPITVTIGEPLTFENLESNEKTWRLIAERIKDSIEAMLPKRLKRLSIDFDHHIEKSQDQGADQYSRDSKKLNPS